ncbi:MAG: hypothetical protein E2O35_08600 [Proteobacteria bacterium]|nr:MAG: hypothetical protein E2O35_08600 [Pseudomonadota bacterium]
MNESRNINGEYKHHIGGDTIHIVGVWLIALRIIQRRTGKARHVDSVVNSGDTQARLM